MKVLIMMSLFVGMVTMAFAPPCVTIVWCETDFESPYLHWDVCCEKDWYPVVDQCFYQRYRNVHGVGSPPGAVHRLYQHVVGPFDTNCDGGVYPNGCY